MSALVTSDEDEDWYTNSRAWSIILEVAMASISPDLRTEYAGHVNSIGVDFTLIDSSKRSEVAHWLLSAVEHLRGPLAIQEGWDTERDLSHLGELSEILRGVIARSSGGPTGGR